MEKLLRAEGRCSDGLLGFCCGGVFLQETGTGDGTNLPRLWNRYVDDTFCIFKKGSAEELLCHLNRFRLTIKFTVEQEFLDTLLRRREDGSLYVSVTRRPTHVPFESHHPTHLEECGEMSPQQGQKDYQRVGQSSEGSQPPS